jgi:hypothetical protein
MTALPRHCLALLDIAAPPRGAQLVQCRLRQRPAGSERQARLLHTVRREACALRCSAAAPAAAVAPERDVDGMAEFLDSLKWDANGMVAAICQVCWMHSALSRYIGCGNGQQSMTLRHPLQHVDTGELLMQAFADRDAVCETLQTGRALPLPACCLPVRCLVASARALKCATAAGWQPFTAARARGAGARGRRPATSSGCSACTPTATATPSSTSATPSAPPATRRARRGRPAAALRCSVCATVCRARACARSARHPHLHVERLLGLGQDACSPLSRPTLQHTAAPRPAPGSAQGRRPRSEKG